MFQADRKDHLKSDQPPRAKPGSDAFMAPSEGNEWALRALLVQAKSPPTGQGLSVRALPRQTSWRCDPRWGSCPDAAVQARTFEAVIADVVVAHDEDAHRSEPAAIRHGVKASPVLPSCGRTEASCQNVRERSRTSAGDRGGRVTPDGCTTAALVRSVRTPSSGKSEFNHVRVLRRRHRCGGARDVDRREPRNRARGVLT